MIYWTTQIKFMLLQQLVLQYKLSNLTFSFTCVSLHHKGVFKKKPKKQKKKPMTDVFSNGD